MVPVCPVTGRCRMPSFFHQSQRFPLIGSPSSMVTTDLLMHDSTVVVFRIQPFATAFRLRSVSVMMRDAREPSSTSRGTDPPLLQQSSASLIEALFVHTADFRRHELATVCPSIRSPRVLRQSRPDPSPFQLKLSQTTFQHLLPLMQAFSVDIVRPGLLRLLRKNRRFTKLWHSDRLRVPRTLRRRFR